MIDLDGEYEDFTKVSALEHWARVLVFLALFLGTLMLLAPRNAAAHDHHHPELDNWYASLHSSAGFPCCNKTDCHRTDAEMRNDGHWWARVGHKDHDKDDWQLDAWVKIPDEKIVRDDKGKPITNPEGEAVICHEVTWMLNEGMFTAQINPVGTAIYCFVTPAQY